MPELAKVPDDQIAVYYATAPAHPLYVEQQGRALLRGIMERYEQEIVRAVALSALADGDDVTTRLLNALRFARSLLEGRTFLARLRAGGRRIWSAIRKQLPGSPRQDTSPDIVEDYVGAVVAAAHSALDSAHAQSVTSATTNVANLVSELREIATAAMGRLLGWYNASFSSLFFRINQFLQLRMGITNYVWLTRLDKRVRAPRKDHHYFFGFHFPLQGAICDWQVPPLTADKATIKKACHAGEDINCRCVAAPFPPVGPAKIKYVPGKKPAAAPAK